MANSNPKAVRGDYSDLYGTTQLPVLEDLFMSEYDRHPMRRESIFNNRTTDRDIYQTTELHDTPLFTSVAEGDNVLYDQPNQGFDRTYTMVKFQRGVSISKEAVADGKFDMIAHMIRSLGKSARETQEVAGMNVFNNGFTSETTPDGQPLFDLAHLNPSGSNPFNNEPTTPSDLTISSLEDNIAEFRQTFLGDTGIIQFITPKILLVPEELRHQAIQLIGSEKRPGSADNNINSVAQDGLQVISSPHLTDTDAWFLLSEKSDHRLDLVVREALSTSAAGPDLGFHNDTMFFKGNYREDIGASGPQGAFGNPGA